MNEYKITRSLPVAKFYYAGSHSHPVRRTILVIENQKNYIRGYELREGSVVRSATTKAPVKTYRKSRIANIGQCGRRLRNRVPKALHARTTYERVRLLDLVRSGV
jgi:hypothetical protein